MTAAVAGVGGGGGGLAGVLEEPHDAAAPGGSSTEGVTPLMYACQQGRDHTVRQILHRKPGSVQERDRTGKTALHYCAENPTLACIDQVVEADPSLLKARDEDGYTPLHLATIAGNRAVAKYLLSKGADVKALDNEKHTVVHWATVCGEVELLDLLIDAGADPSTPDIHGAYPLHYAAQMCGPNSEMGNDVRVGLLVLRKLLQRGVDVSVTDHDGRQPLLWAASAGSADAILALINAGASVSAEDKDGLTALHCAASRGHLDCLDCLVNFCGAEVDTLDSNGCTPLFYAVTLGHADCTQLLLHHGGHPDKQDRKGRTPAHCGAAKGQLETLKLLHRKGADLWKRNVKGDLPLHEACQSGRKDLVLWLLSMRPDTVNAPNLDGRCPLHIAAINNNIEMCKILMDKQAAVNPIMRNSRGQLLTPLDAAVARSNRGCAKYLQLHGGVAASKLTDKHALQKAMQRALETSQGRTGATPGDATGDELMSSSASSVLKSNMSTMTASPVNIEAQTDTGDLKNGEEGERLQHKDAQESGYSDGLVVERDSDVDGPTDPERHTEDEDTHGHTSRRKTKTRKKRSKQREERQGGGAALSEDGGDGRAGGGQAGGRDGDMDGEGDVEDDDDGRGPRRRRGGRGGRSGRASKGSRGGGGKGGDEGGEEYDDDISAVPEGEGDDYYDDEDADEDALRKLGVVGTHRRPGVRRGQVRSGAMSGGPKKVENMESNLKRRSRKAASPSTEVSITQAMQNAMRKYALERRLFQQLLELKRIQIRNTRANEHVMIKRMVETFQKEGNLLGLRGYGGPFNFNSYEKYLYDQLRFLQSSQGVKIPAFRPTDDVERLSRAIRRAEIRELPEPLMTPRDASACNHTTHRCHHAAHAYTGVPCAAYIGYARKKRSSNNNNNKQQVSLPRIAGTSNSNNNNNNNTFTTGGGGGGSGTSLGNSPGPPLENAANWGKSGEPVGLRNYDPKKPLTVELQHGQARQQIILPTEILDKNKKYHLTFSIKPTTPVPAPSQSPTKEAEQAEVVEPPTPERSASAPESVDPEKLAPEARQELHSAPAEARTEA